MKKTNPLTEKIKTQKTNTLIDSLTIMDASDRITWTSAEYMVQASICEELEKRFPELILIMDQWVETMDERTYAKVIIDSIKKNN